MSLGYALRCLALGLVLGTGTRLLAADAAGVIASVRGQVFVDGVGSGPARKAELGMRLDPGEAVRVGPEGSAAVYLSGEHGIVRLASGEHLTLPKTPDGAKGPRSAAPASAALRDSEAGLWILNDPQGSMLVAAMRGGEEGSGEQAPTAAIVLSPRRETVTGAPIFYATGGSRPARVALASGKEVVWRSGSLSGDGPWSIESLPELRAGGLYLWRLESVANGSALSDWTPFRVASAAERDSTRAFELEVAKLTSGADDTAAADLLRCGYYLQMESWTPLLAAARRILASSPDARIGRLARDRAIQEMHLDAERAVALERKLGESGP